jgi:Protein of unknown function (DUF5674)
MKQVDRISVKELQHMAENMFGSMVKAVVDIEKKLVVVDAEMHYDEEQFLMEHGSKQLDLWGINLYPEQFGTKDFIEYDSMINVRSNHGNPSRDVENPGVRRKIEQIISEVVHE